MKYPLVSVCIPAYNAEKYISAALDSILNQSYPNIEIIVVNDGSTDGTSDVLDNYRSRGVHVIHQSNSGQCAAANTAFRQSTGDYIKFFDADDILSPDFITYQVQKLNGRKDAIASSSWGRFVGDDLGSFKLQPEHVWKDLKPIDWLVTSLGSGHNMMQCGIWLIPREVLRVSGLWNESLTLINDFDFFIRVLLSAEDVLYTPDAILYYRSFINNSLSSQKTRKAMESALMSVQNGASTILQFENSSRTRKVCADVFQLWKYNFFPQHYDLFEIADKAVKDLGGSDYPFQAGEIGTKLTKIFGWKFVKRIKQYV